MEKAKIIKGETMQKETEEGRHKIEERDGQKIVVGDEE
jgi:hypothetical protein